MADAQATSDRSSEAFHGLHEQLYGHADRHGAGGADQPAREGGGDDAQAQGGAGGGRRGPAPASGHREIHYRGQRHRAAIHGRTTSWPGRRLRGPGHRRAGRHDHARPARFRGDVDAFGNITITASASLDGSRRRSRHGHRRRHAGDPAQLLPGHRRGHGARHGAHRLHDLRQGDGRLLDRAHRPPAGSTSPIPGGSGPAVPRHQHEAGHRLLAHYDAGDIVISTTPTRRAPLCTHLPDIHLLRPIFRGGQIIACAYAFVHSSDIGGAVPASVWPRAREIFQEGLRLRPTKLFRAGVPNQDILNLFADNCRIPDMNWGDIKAMVAAVNTCDRRLQAMVEKFGQPTVTGAMTALLDYAAERCARGARARFRDGTYRFVDYVEDDMVSDVPIRIEVAMTVRAGTSTSTTPGRDPQVGLGAQRAEPRRAAPVHLPDALRYIITLDPGHPEVEHPPADAGHDAAGDRRQRRVPGPDRGPLRHRAPPLRCRARRLGQGRCPGECRRRRPAPSRRSCARSRIPARPAPCQRRRADARRRGGAPGDGRAPRR